MKRFFLLLDILFTLYCISLVTGSTNSSGVALVLASPSPVTWHLTVSGPAPSPAPRPAPRILISDGSRVLDTASGAELAASVAILSSKEITEKLALAQFSSIHTFTSLAAANRIFINLKKGERQKKYFIRYVLDM